jgi:murein DD-endopeptidase MepM/ murein hydrolase activator NlpD
MGRLLLLIIALVCIGVLWLGSGGDPLRVSAWEPQRLAASAGAPDRAPAGGLSGFATLGQQGRGLPGEQRPYGNPLRATNTVMTQGYGVGSHAPAGIWGAIDLALDGNGDGVADPDSTQGKPVYATHAGVVQTTPNSHPAGNHIWVTNDAYRTGYSHLAGFAVNDGQVVSQGDLIGFVGSTGMSSGPHLDYQVWLKQGDSWVNVNPLDYEALSIGP